MKRSLPPLAVAPLRAVTPLLAAVLLLTACSSPTPAPTDGAAGTSAIASSSADSTHSATATTASPNDGPVFNIRYGWGVPSEEVAVEHPLNAPLPGDVPLPHLVEVRTGDHQPDGYSRITFAFRGAYPGYRLQYVRQVTEDGTGNPIALPGTSFLQIVFNPAQAHDNAGNTTVKAGVILVNYRHLTSYTRAGDYEAYVTFGLGITVAPGSDQALPIRVGELVRVDGAYVVAVDVRNG